MAHYKGIPLPAVINQLADAAGLDAALTLCFERGGTRFCVPAKRPQGTLLEMIVGPADARKIVAALGGSRIDIPCANRLLVHWLRNKGWSQERIANRLRLSRRMVQYVLTDTTPRRDAWGGKDAEAVG